MLQTHWKTSQNLLRMLQTLFQVVPSASPKRIRAHLGLLYLPAPVSISNSLMLAPYYPEVILKITP